MRAAVVEQTAAVGRIDHLPQVERDLAVIVGKRVAAGDVAKRSATVPGPHLVGLDLFDRYQGPPLADDEISLAYRLRFQPHERRCPKLTSTARVEAVIRSLEREVGGRIRSGS